MLSGRYKRVDLYVIDEIRNRWPEVVGESLAARCVPELVKDGELIVRVPNGAYAERLRSDERGVLRRLAEISERAPTGLRVVVGDREN